MHDKSVIKEDRNAYEKDNSEDCNNEIKNDISDVNIRDLFNDISW